VSMTLAEKLDDMTLHDETGDPRDEGYMAAVRELRDWMAEPGLLDAIEALRYMADPKSWLGNPESHSAVLFGHGTPFELARDTLAKIGAI
jgi:hypothetical protein